MSQSYGIDGMAIELWEHIAKNLDVKSSFKEYHSTKELIEAAASKEIDVAVTNITITEHRSELVDFTQPWYATGLRIMTSDKIKSGSSGLIQGLRDAGHLQVYFWMALIVLVLTFIVTVFDRKTDKEFPRNWKDGIAESFYFVMVLVTNGKVTRKNPFGWYGRIISGLWLLIGVLIVAYVTSSITSVMTTLSINGEINSLADIQDNKVAVIAGSVSEDYVLEKGINYVPCSDMDDALTKLNEGDILAIIGDAQVLEYYAFVNSNDPVKVVGKMFKPDNFAFATPRNSKWTRPITLELLKTHENGYIGQLRSKYFGKGH